MSGKDEGAGVKGEGSSLKAEPELKPCPFCGSSDVHVIENLDVQCKECDAYGPEKPSREKAVNAWNTRPAAPPVIDQALVGRIVERARSSRVALGEPDKGDLSYDLSNWAPQDFFAVANVLVGAHSAKYDMVSLFAAAMEEVAES